MCKTFLHRKFHEKDTFSWGQVYRIPTQIKSRNVPKTIMYFWGGNKNRDQKKKRNILFQSIMSPGITWVGYISDKGEGYI